MQLPRWFLLAVFGGCATLEPIRTATPITDPASPIAPEPTYRAADNPLTRRYAADLAESVTTGHTSEATEERR